MNNIKEVWNDIDFESETEWQIRPGHIEQFTDDLKKKPCLIVDDICDGGRTFIGIAKALKETVK
jgi:phosphoribosylpyrophosphate synthetase